MNYKRSFFYTKLTIILIFFKIGLSTFNCDLSGKEIVYDNYIYENAIKTVQIFKTNNQLSYPIIDLQKQNTLTLQFDDLKSQSSNYYIDFVHCNFDWTPSSLMPIDFFTGFPSQPINDISVSQGTLVSFIHYHIEFPTNGNKFLHSGNYLLRVFRDADESDLIITRRFVVTEEVIKIQPDLGFTPDVEKRFQLQSVNFNIYPGGYDFQNPFTRNHVSVLQNFRWNKSKNDLEPAYVYPNRLEYRFDSRNDFDGGNEYRYFDIRNNRQSIGRLREIQVTDSGTFVRLNVDVPKTNKPYTTEPDFNGNFFIGKRETLQEYEMVESDYTHVRFLLDTKHKIYDGEMYVFGQFTDWQIKDEYKMYPVEKGYYRDILLKQGIYNYHYVLVNNKSKKIDENTLEGNFFETENYYTIIIYSRSPKDRADRIIGLKHINYYDD